MHGTHVPLRKWIIATYMISESKKSISALQLSRMLNVTHTTAWFMGHRIRNALAKVIHPKLSNVVEVDETWVGRRRTGNQRMVIGIVERRGNAILKVRKDRTRHVLYEFILSHVSPDVVAIYTDAWPAYRGLPNHASVNHSAWEWARMYRPTQLRACGAF